MGTNYYVVKNGPSVQEPVHIGKSSAGWLFNVQAQNDKWHEPPVIWNTFDQVKAWLKANTVDSTDYVIIDEYDAIIPFDDFVELVERKQNDPFCPENKDNFSYARNVNGYRYSEEEFC